MNSLTQNDIWKIAEKLLTKNNGNELVKHHLDSYNLFVDKYIPSIIHERDFYDIPSKWEDITEKRLDDDQKEIDYVIRKQYRYKIKFIKEYTDAPMFKDKESRQSLLYPHIARERNLTYSVPLFVDIEIVKRLVTYDPQTNTKTEKEISNETFNRELLANIPLMVNSRLCNTNKLLYKDEKKDMCKFDKGGYFIVKGNEKVIVSQERVIYNKCLYIKPKDKRFSHGMSIRTNNDMTDIAKVMKILFKSKNGLSGDRTLKIFMVKILKTPMPLFVVFKYLGAKNDKEIVQYIIGDRKNSALKSYLRESLTELHAVYDAMDAKKQTLKQWIESRLCKKDMDADYVFKHRILGNLKTNKEKMIFLGHMVRKLIQNIMYRKEEMDRDNFVNKRIETSGVLLSQLFKKLFKDIMQSLRNTVNKELDWQPTKHKILKQSIVTNKINGCLATGNWDSKMSAEHKKSGIAQMLKRLTYIATISHLRRVNSPTAKTGKLFDPRKLHNSQMGYFCPAESPEGHQVGLIKNLALSSVISNYSDPNLVYTILCKLSADVFTKADDIDMSKVGSTHVFIFINGKIYGVTDKPHVVRDHLVTERRHGRLNSMVSVSYKPENEEINIYTNECRLIRPLFILKDNKLNLSDETRGKIQRNEFNFVDLLKEGVIEYIDTSENETVMIAKNWKHLDANKHKTVFTHCEIDNSLLFGVTGSLIPFPEHNQAPRVLYQCAQAKQAIGINTTEAGRRLDTVSHILHYSQKPLVYTKTSDIIGMNDLPAGQNCIVAIGCYGAYNIEDSLIMNRGAIERGLFRATTFRTYKTENKKDMSANSREEFCNPTKRDDVEDMKSSNLYKHLDDNGIVTIGARLKEKDVLVGKISPIQEDNKTRELDQNGDKQPIVYTDKSVQVKQKDKGIVDKICIADNNNGEHIVKIRLRNTRIPEVADKCSSRHGQKSTIGIILNEEDMPVSESGICPDIIINPHCLPSRMTVGQILECVLGKASAVDGTFFDATAFHNNVGDTNNVDKYLTERGFDGSGREVLFNPETGDEMEAKIFMGPTYYQRLKHLVSDKMHARGIGPVNKLTQQPTEGRSKGGGFKIGHMEVDCIHSHGMSNFLQDKFFDGSDKYFTHVCGKCNNLCLGKNIKCTSEPYCTVCDNKDDIRKIALPYSSKLLLYEIASMGVNTKFHTK